MKNQLNIKLDTESFSPKKILFIRSGALGDVLMTTPLVGAIRMKFPQARISYLTGRWSVPAIENNKDVDEIIEMEDSALAKKDIFYLIKLAKQIAEKDFDLGIVLDKAYQWNLFCAKCKIKTRIGFDRKGEGFPNHFSVDFDAAKNEIEYYLDIARCFGIKNPQNYTKIFLKKSDETFAYNCLSGLKKKIICLSPGGAKNPGQAMFSKRWPLDYYAELIEKLSTNYDFILIGGKDDLDVSTKIRQLTKSKYLDFIGKTTLAQSAAILKKCDLFITHDSGPMHIAFAVRTPIIALFGPTPAKRFAPPHSIIIQSKQSSSYDIYGNSKDSGSMKTIQVNQVMNRVKSFFNN